MVVRMMGAGDTLATMVNDDPQTQTRAAPLGPPVDLATLSWCIGEIRDALHQTETALDAQRLAETDDTASLRMARLHLHQAHGALLVVDVPAASVLTQEAEAVLDVIASGTVKLDATVMNALRAAFAACIEYLDDLLLERPDRPLYLFPYLQTLRKLRGAEREHPADLFFPDLTRRLPDSVVLPQVSIGAFDPADAQDATDARKAFEKGLLKFLREPAKPRGIDYMLAAVGMVERHEKNNGSRNFWRITLAFLEALRLGHLDADVYSKRLLARLNLQLRKSVNEGSQVADRLVQDTLYALACSRGGSALVDTVRAIYGLEGVVPGDFMTPRYGRHDSRTIRAARDALNQSRIAWDSVSRGNHADAGALVQALIGFQAAVKSLPIQGMQSLASVLVDTGQAMAIKPALFEAPVALEAATAILFADQILEQGGRAGEEFDPQAAELATRLSRALTGADIGSVPAWLQALSAAAQDRMTMASFIRETLASLRAAEQELDGFFRDHAKRAALPDAKRQLLQVAGALQVLGYQDAANGAQATAIVVGGFAEATADPDAEDCERVAANCGALGFFVEGLQQAHRQTGLFEFDAESGEFRARLAESPRITDMPPQATSVDHKQHADDLLASLQQAPADDSVRAQLRGALEQVRDDALLRDDGTLKKQAAAAIDLLAVDSPEGIDKLSEALAKMTPAMAVTPAPAPSRIPDDAAAIDQELLEIFLAEADEVLEAIDTASAASRRAPSDLQFLTTIRRGFHTLKGSSRMVGLNAFGEAGWSLEQVMNLWLADERAGDPELYALIDDARVQMLDWVRQLEADATVRIDPAALIATADAFGVSGKYVAIVPAPAEPVTQELSAVDTIAEDAISEAAISEAAIAQEAVAEPAFGEEAIADQALSIAEDIVIDEAPVAPLDLALPADSGFDLVRDDAAQGVAFDLDEAVRSVTTDTSRWAPLIDPKSEQDPADEVIPFDAAVDNALSPDAIVEIDFDLSLDIDTSSVSETRVAADPDPVASLGEVVDRDVEAPAIDLASLETLADEPQIELPAFDAESLRELALTDDDTDDTSAGVDVDVTLPPIDLTEALSQETAIDIDEPIELTDRIEVTEAFEPLRAADLAELGLSPDALGEPTSLADDALADDPFASFDSLQSAETVSLPASEIIELDVLSPLSEPDMGADPSEFSAQMDLIVASLINELPVDAAARAQADTAERLDGGAPQPAPIEPSAPPPAASPQPLTDTVVIGERSLSRPLYEIYLGEADGLIESLASDVESWRAQPDRLASEPAARAAHSLCGTSALVGLDCVRDLAARLEEVHLTQARTAFALADADFAAMGKAVDSMRAMRQAFADGRMPVEDADALDGLALLQLRMLTTQPVQASAPSQSVDAAIAEPAVDAVDAPAAAAVDASAAEAVDVPAADAIEAPAIDASAGDSIDPPAIEVADTTTDEFDTVDRASIDSESIDRLAPDNDTASAPGLVINEESAPPVVDELDAELLPIFIEEADDLLPGMGTDLRRWAENPSDSARARNLMRALHTVKGSARMAGAMTLGQLVHEMETRIETLTVLPVVPRGMIDELITDHDQVMSLFEAIKDPAKAAAAAAAVTPLPGTSSVANGAGAASAIVALLPATSSDSTAFASGTNDPTGTAAAAAAAADAAAASSSVAPAPKSAVARPGHPAVEGKPSTQLVRVRADLLDRVVNEAGEASIARSKLDNELSSMRQSLADLTENVNRLRTQLREIEIQAESQIQAQTREADRSFDPLEFDRYTRFQELTRMMAESVNDVATVQQNAGRNLDEAAQELVRQGQVLRDLQQNLMRVRMVQFGTIADRLFRVARQAAKETGKRVNLDVRGSAVEVDRGVLEKMAGPLEHLVRNAVAHGIESRDQRQANGKAETGEIRVEVRQEGNEIILIMADDGGGLDLARIRARAVASGLIAEEAALSDRELRDLIFAPGFSTADKVTELSGRGVGMDVVRVETSALGGRIETDSVPGRGSRFTIHLPLTLAVAQVVLMGAAGARFAVPSSSVEQVLQFKPQALADGYANGHVDWQGNKVPLFYLGALVELQDRSPVAQHYSPVAILRSGNQRIALHVDTLARNQEVVVKNVGPQVSRVHGVSGATVLGNGDIVLIINPVQLAIEAVGPSLDALSASVPMIQRIALEMPACVMVVDDSVTVRKVTQRLLAREGYQVLLAKDGVDALRQLQDTVPDVMLVDIEMPRMDGFDLTRAVRADERYAAIPIVMITSRTADKHRNMAFELGVNAYLGKPYSEEELLRQIDGFLKAAGRSSAQGVAH